MNKKQNPYYIDEPCVISFSGGRTSGYMLYRILDVFDGDLPDDKRVVFANTGKEIPETLDFVKRCADEWGVEIVWVERRAIRNTEEKPKYLYETKQVNYLTASRDGGPFRDLVLARRYAPNPVARFCTQDMKIRAIVEYMKSEGFETPILGAIGIRADEESRAVKMNGKIESGQERYLPLYLDGVTRKDVFDFWRSHKFDLELPNNNGVTDWGNCDLCFLKGLNKKLSIIRERPDLADWWIELELELELSEAVGKGAYFRADQPSYKDMKRMALETDDMFSGMDESIPCFCGD